MGFMTEKVLSEADQKKLLCQRCFRIRNYSDVISVSVSNDDYLNVINQISKENALIVKIVDIFDFSGSFVPAIKRILIYCLKMLNTIKS